MKSFGNVVFLAACFALSSGCSPSGGFSTTPPSDATQTNAKREQIGIRPVKGEWSFYGREFMAEKWREGTNLCKVVQRDKNAALVFEEDYYYSGASYFDSKGDLELEMLSVKYDYTGGRFALDYAGTNGAVFALFGKLAVSPFGPKDAAGVQTAAHMGTNDEQTLRVADDVLALWSMKRL